MSGAGPADVERQIGDWRDFLASRHALSPADVTELEGHLRDQMADLARVGLSADEAFLVAVKRLGAQDELSSQFAREHSDRLWKQLVRGASAGQAGSRLPLAVGLGLAAGVAVKLPDFFGYGFVEGGGGFFPRNLAVLVLPFLAAYFLWRRDLRPMIAGVVAAGFALLAVVLNAYPFAADSDTETLAIIHGSVALWLLVGVAYAAGTARSGRTLMDFVRFTGEWLVYFALIALGGMVLLGLTQAAFHAIGHDADVMWFTNGWVLPFAVPGAVLVAAWLVEAKQSVVENMAPVLTRVFTPLFTLMLLVFLGTLLWSAAPAQVNRDALIIVDLVLLAVFGLLLFTVSARDPLAAPTWFDRLQLGLVASALAVDLAMLYVMVGRLGASGLTPNRVAALGINALLLVNLVWSLVLLVGFLRGSRRYASLERLQVGYLPVLGGWALLVAVAFPPVFGFA